MPPQTDEQLRHLIANYYGMISLIDHNVGRMLIALADNDLADNTIVVFTSDHGEWLGDHGLVLKGPMNYEGLVRVGLILQGAGIPEGRLVDDPVSTLDLAATFYDYCGVDAGRGLHGRTLRPLIDGNGDTRDFAYNEWNLHPQRALSSSLSAAMPMLGRIGSTRQVTNEPTRIWKSVPEESAVSVLRHSDRLGKCAAHIARARMDHVRQLALQGCVVGIAEQVFHFVRIVRKIVHFAGTRT